MRVVLDTNIFVAAGFKRGSASDRILAAVRDGRLALVWDARTRSETLYILGKIPPLRARTPSDLFRPEHEHAVPEPGDLAPFEPVPDPADRAFAALAAAADATLVTNDAHLLDVRTRIPARIRRPGEFLDEVPEIADAPG